MRLEDEIPLLPGLKAFRRSDGLADSVCVLRLVLCEEAHLSDFRGCDKSVRFSFTQVNG